MSVPKACIVPAPTTVKLPHASGHSSGNRQGHVAKTKTHRFEIFVAFRFTNVYLLLDSSHHLYILSYYHSFNGISSLANYMAKLLWEWKPRFAVALVVRGMLIVTSHTNCDVTGCPVVMRSYANADEDEQWCKTSKTQVSLAFCNIVIIRIEIDHLYGLRCRGWYCNPAQHSLCLPARAQAGVRRPAQLVLCRMAVPTTPA